MWYFSHSYTSCLRCRTFSSLLSSHFEVYFLVKPHNHNNNWYVDLMSEVVIFLSILYHLPNYERMIYHR